VAPEGDTHDHPPDPVLISKEQAGFWYNPALGVFRARVPQQVTAQETLTLYNRVNGTALLSLPVSDDPARQPQRPAWGAIRARPAGSLTLGADATGVVRPVESAAPARAREAAPRHRPRRALHAVVAVDCVAPPSPAPKPAHSAASSGRRFPWGRCARHAGR